MNARSKGGITPLAWSCYGDDLQRVAFLISKGADLNAGKGITKTALHIAANWGKTEIASLLITKGADVDALDGSGWTPLHWAAFEGGYEVVQLLISKGAKKNAKTLKRWSIFPAGSTSLDVAEQAHFYDMAAFLKTKGCKRGIEMK